MTPQSIILYSIYIITYLPMYLYQKKKREKLTRVYLSTNEHKRLSFFKTKHELKTHSDAIDFLLEYYQNTTNKISVLVKEFDKLEKQLHKVKGGFE